MLRRGLFIICILLSMLPFTRAQGIDGLDVPWHPTPRIDGIIGDGEYPPPALSLASNCRLYLCQNESFLFIAVAIPDSTYSVDDGVTICIGSEPPSLDRTPRADDYQVIVSRSGTFSAFGLNRIKIATTTDSGGWRAEVAIGFSELDLTAGKPSSLGFALFIMDGGQEFVRWPENADKTSPKTWGTLYSSYSWGSVDLAAQSMTLGTQTPIMGENVTLYFAYMNRGSSSISGAQIVFYVDSAPIMTIDDSRVIKTSESYVVSALWRATAGNHTIRVKLDPLDNIHETREDNNEYSVNVSVKPASLKIRAQEGVNVTVDGIMATVGPSKEITLNVNLGVHEITAQETLYMGDTRYVFNKWEWDVGESNENAMALSVTGDVSLEASYRTEYMVRLRFLDSKGINIIKPSEVRFTAPNGSSMILGTYEIWLQQGTITITNVVWSSVDVKPVDTTYQIQGPRTLTMRCSVFDLTVELSDSLSLPVSGANVTLILANQTRVWLLTDSDGKAQFTQIPAGSLSGTVSNLGFITPIPEQDLTSDSVIRLSLALSTSTIIFVAMVAIVVISGLIIWRVRTKRKRLPPPPPPPPSSIVDQEQPSPPPPMPSEQGKYKSQFHCKACGNLFWVYEYRLKVSYCLECGAPDPEYVVTVSENNI